jgi:5-methylcytosine-specific restriction protein A
MCDKPATVVDHIMELADGGAMWDHANWQPLCGPHHDTKTRQAALKRAQRLASLKHQDRNTETVATRIWNQLP